MTPLFDITTVSGIGDYTVATDTHDDRPRTIYSKDDKAFLIINPHTIEVRTDAELSQLLRDKYESVMTSRYFGRGGIEVVLAGAQLSSDELQDLVRLSYNLS